MFCLLPIRLTSLIDKCGFDGVNPTPEISAYWSYTSVFTVQIALNTQ